MSNKHSSSDLHGELAKGNVSRASQNPAPVRRAAGFHSHKNYRQNEMGAEHEPYDNGKRDLGSPFGTISTPGKMSISPPKLNKGEC